MKKGLLIILLAVIRMHSFAQYNPAVHGVPEIEYNALVAFYNATDGNNWKYNTNWLSPTSPVGKWTGITVEKGYVTKIVLRSNKLTGELPEEFYNLSDLTILDLYANDLTGQISNCISNFSKLEILNLYANDFTGKIPENFNLLINLKELFLFGSFYGTSFPNLQNLTNLELLDITFMAIQSRIPGWIGNFPNLKTLNLDGPFRGVIPNELNNLSKLEELNIDCSQLDSSSFPYLRNLTNLKKLTVSNSKIFGQIPEWIGELSQLERISLTDNQLSGAIPTQMSQLINLKQLWLNNNNFEPGPIPYLAPLINLNILQLINCNLTGEIPDWFSNLKSLGSLDMDNNQLTGSLNNICGLTNLDYVSLMNNKLTGSIPKEISQLKKMDIFYVSNNQLEGTIPEELFKLPYIFDYWLNNNYFTDIEYNSEQSINIHWSLRLDNNIFEFDDLIPFINKLKGKYYYSSQSQIGEKRDTELILGTNYILDIESHYEGNLFQWFKNGTAINSSLENSSFLLENIDETDAGAYTCRVTNPQAPDLTLFSRPINISVVQCAAQSYNIDVSICEGESYENHTIPGVYTDSLVNLKGCDSIVINNLNVIPTYTRQEEVKICEGESYKNHTTPGIFTDTLSSLNGCDSIVRTLLNFYPKFNEKEEVTICHGESYFGWDRAGTYKRTLSSASGCDSMITTRLTLFPENKTTITRFADTLRCDRQYQKYFWYYNTQFVEEIDSFRLDIQKSGNYYVVGLDENGCLNQSETIYYSLTGIDEIEKEEEYFSIYPNPTKGSIKIKVDNSILPVTINISNVFGEVLLQISDYENEELRLDLSWLAKGFYLVMLSNNRIRQSQKICLE
jgi:Leucine-rich repeat (LRR) protein